MFVDRKGDFGFLESMIAMMAVIMVLTAYLGAMAGGYAVSFDPTDGLDPDMFTGSVESGSFVPTFETYLLDYLDAHNLEGAAVTVKLPGWDCGMFRYVTGSMDGEISTRSFSTLVSADGGREIIAMVEVSLCD